MVFEPGGRRKVRLHSKTVVSGRMSGLLCIMAVATAGSGVIRIGITKSSLKEAKNEKLSTTKPENRPQVEERFKAIEESFETVGLIDTTNKRWRESRFKHIAEEDRTTVRSVLENGDEILLTPTPQTLPNWLKSIGVTISTPREFLLAFSDTNPGPDPEHTKTILAGVLWEHREATGLSDRAYNAFLCSERLEPLIKLLPPRDAAD